MDEINRRRLEWMRDAKTGAVLPPGLFDDSNNWGEAASGAVKAALDEIERLQEGWGLAGFPTWQPIDTAPVEPWDNVPSYYRFKCLLQIPSGHPGNPPEVCEGEAYYTTKPRHPERRILRWRNQRGMCFPKYWMPLPAPKVEP